MLNNSNPDNKKASLVTGGARRARSFSYLTDSRPGSKVPKGDLTIKRTGRLVELIRPHWEGALPTIVRFLPMWNPDNPAEFDPTRLSSRAYDISDFMRSYPAVKWVGLDRRLTFILFDPRWVREGIYDPDSHPYTILNNAVNSAVLAGKAMVGGRDVIGGSWFSLVSDRSKKKAFARPTKISFGQVAVYSHDKEVFGVHGEPPKGLRPDDHTHILQMTNTAGMGLLGKIEKTRPAYTGDTDDFEQYYQHGMLVDLRKGEFVVFRNPDKHDPMSDEDQDAEPPKGDSSFNRWEVDVIPELRLTVKGREQVISPDLSKFEADIRKRVTWWDDIIHIPGHEEICVQLATAFRSEPDILRFGWADHPEFFTDEVQAILNNRTQVAMSAEGQDYEDADDTPTFIKTGKQSAAITAFAGELDDVGEDDHTYDADDYPEDFEQAKEHKLLGKVPKKNDIN